MRFVYLLESPRRGDSDKYPKRMFSQRITRDCQCKTMRFVYFCADWIGVVANFAILKNAIIKRVLCTFIYITTDYLALANCQNSITKHFGQQFKWFITRSHSARILQLTVKDLVVYVI